MNLLTVTIRFSRLQVKIHVGLRVCLYVNHLLNTQYLKKHSLGLPNTDSPATAGSLASPDVPPNDDSLRPIPNTHNQNSETLLSPERPTTDQPMPNQPMPDQPTPDPHLFIPNDRRIRAKNGHVWNTQPQPTNTRTPLRNIVFTRREVCW